MSLKTQTAGGVNMKGERSAEERAEQCPSLFYFLQRLIHVRTSGPDIRADYQSTIAAPEATGHGLAQTHSVSERRQHATLQPAACRRGEESETSSEADRLRDDSVLR